VSFRCVEGDVNRNKPRHPARPASPRRSLLTIVLCLAVLAPLVAAAPAMALSGYASGQLPVNAQYPDADNNGSVEQGGAPLGTLSLLMTATQRQARTPRARARQRQFHRRIVRQESAALASAAGLTPSQSGSLVLLFGAILVVSVGGVLRWRRS
jgi:hypothetical protein